MGFQSTIFFSRRGRRRMKLRQFAIYFFRFMRILDAGYIIGEDLIVTHEDRRHPLMTEDIDRIIEKYLV